MKISPKSYANKLPLPKTEKWPDGVWDIEAFRHGSMSLVFFAPEGKDYQSAHDQDELYFVVRGAGVLTIEGEGNAFHAGDVLFVPAGKDHQFIGFERGTQVWAVFYGPKDGERGA